VTPLIGGVTDGAARIRLQLIAKENQSAFSNLMWKIYDPQLKSDPQPTDVTKIRGTLLDANGNPTEALYVTFNSEGIAEAVYRSPETFVRRGTSKESLDKESAERQIQPTLDLVYSLITGIERLSPIQLKRTPVVLVHGLWGNESAWDVFEPKFNDKGFHTVVRADYFVDGEVLSIGDKNVVQPHFQYAMDEAIGKSRKELFAANRVDIVAHSMGGLVTRQYCFDNKTDCQNRIRRFITIATPHFGSELADLLLVYRDDQYNFPNLPLCRKIVDSFVTGFRWKKLGMNIELAPSPIYPKGGAIDDLATGNLLSFIPKMPMGRWADLPPLASALSSHVIVGLTASDAAWGGYDPNIIGLWHLILPPCGISRELLFSTEADSNDRIVKKYSQQGGVGGGNQTIVEKTDHFTVRNSDDTVKGIRLLLDEPMGSNLFTK